MPSESVPWPVKVTGLPRLAGFGDMESMTATGGWFTDAFTVRDRVTGADVAPSSSVTVRVMVCVPWERDDVEKDALLPMVPLMLEVHR